jgi:hypothetical protein
MAVAAGVAVERTFVGVGVNEATIDVGSVVAGTAVGGRLVAVVGVDTLPTCPQPVAVSKSVAINVVR